MNAINTTRKVITPAVRNGYREGLTWFLAQGNRDGSWGTGNKQRKITYTAQAIQLLLEADFFHGFDDERVPRALKWLRTNATKDDRRYYSSVEIALRVGDTHGVLADGGLHAFLADLHHDLDHPHNEQRFANERFFWHVLPILIALRPFEDEFVRDGKIAPVPHIGVADRLEGMTRYFREDCACVKAWPNFTGLSAVYLHAIRDVDIAYERRARSLATWLVQSLVEDHGAVTWLRSRTITSYVLMDLLALGVDYQTMLDESMERILTYLTPRDGSLDGDLVPTFETRLHTERLYATILGLRAIAAAIRVYEPDVLDPCREYALKNRKGRRSYSARRTRLLIKRNAPWIAVPLIGAGGLATLAVGLVEIGSGLIIAAFAELAALLAHRRGSGGTD